MAAIQLKQTIIGQHRIKSLFDKPHNLAQTQVRITMKGTKNHATTHLRKNDKITYIADKNLARFPHTIMRENGDLAKYIGVDSIIAIELISTDPELIKVASFSFATDVDELYKEMTEEVENDFIEEH